MGISMDKIVNHCKTRGFVFPGSDIYGGLANSWDYGPLGVELKNNIKQAWWKKFVTSRLDMVGLDAALLMNPKVWEASGHVATFSDPLVECRKCHARFRADDASQSFKVEFNAKDLPRPEDLNQSVAYRISGNCPNCGALAADTFTDPSSFNLMLKTFLGPKEDASATVYFRPETAQAMFVDFQLVQTSSRKRIPFGIAQIGKAFRNEITPGNFIFRQREFEQMEIEYFIHPKDWEKHFELWLTAMHEWTEECGITQSAVHDLEVPVDELAHYSKRTVDIEYDFPFGKKELYGLAYRTDFDLTNHGQASGKEITYTDPDTNEKYVPHVIEPSFGVDRTFLAILTSAYQEEAVEEDVRIVLRLPKHLAPIKVAILPLSKKDELAQVAYPLAEQLAKRWRVDYDETQSIGKRYRRQDEIGTPLCVTVDFETLADQAVTVRDRDTMQQERVPLAELEAYLSKQLGG
ncbi:MAG: glycine--tRNA ligase [Patescibacteria group bacterium]